MGERTCVDERVIFFVRFLPLGFALNARQPRAHD